MSRGEYYTDLKCLAREIRCKYSVTSYRVMPSEVKRMLRKEGVDYIDLSDRLVKMRGAYFYAPGCISVLVKKGLPPDPYSFTLAHELKHHLVDKDMSQVLCTFANQNEMVEIGAEIFAAELIFPEEDFLSEIESLATGQEEIDERLIVQFKKKTQTTLSYQGIVKRLEHNRIVPAGCFKATKWKKVEESIFGIPFYKRKMV